MRRKELEPALPLFVVIAVMAVGMAANVDIGIRHILPLYPFLALLGARGVIDLWTRAGSTRLVKGFTVGARGEHVVHRRARASRIISRTSIHSPVRIPSGFSSTAISIGVRICIA